MVRQGFFTTPDEVFAWLSGFINRVLSEKSRCRSLSLIEGENASVTLVLFSDNVENCRVEERLASITAPLGLHVRVVWADRGAPETEWLEAVSFVYQNPWMWMLMVSMIALSVIAGLKGLFWTLFWGTAAWFASKAVTSFLVKRKMGFFEARR